MKLQDPEQSSTRSQNSCEDNKCTADSVIDDNLNSRIVTTNLLGVEWWSATLPGVVDIATIMVFASGHALNKGYYGKFKVDTRLTEKKEWVVCKGPYSLNEPHFPHIVQCNASITLAKYIRLSVGGNKNLYLYEVKVAGTVKGESKIHISKS